MSRIIRPPGWDEGIWTAERARCGEGRRRDRGDDCACSDRRHPADSKSAMAGRPAAPGLSVARTGMGPAYGRSSYSLGPQQYGERLGYDARPSLNQTGRSVGLLSPGAYRGGTFPGLGGDPEPGDLGGG
jgi:hypothetical protein